MLKFFRRRPPIARMVSLTLFRCSSRLKIGKEVEVAVVLPDEHAFLVTLHVLGQAPDGVYEGKILPPLVAEMVAEAFAVATGQTYYKVDQDPTHHLRRYVVRSRDLPGYKALTTDVSMAKARLAVSGRLDLGQPLQLSLELDDQRLPPIALEAEVISCSAEVPGVGCEVSVRWTPAPEGAPIMLEYLQGLKRGV